MSLLIPRQSIAGCAAACSGTYDNIIPAMPSAEELGLDEGQYKLYMTLNESFQVGLTEVKTAVTKVDERVGNVELRQARVDTALEEVRAAQQQQQQQISSLQSSPQADPWARFNNGSGCGSSNGLASIGPASSAGGVEDKIPISKRQRVCIGGFRYSEGDDIV